MCLGAVQLGHECFSLMVGYLDDPRLVRRGARFVDFARTVCCRAGDLDVLERVVRDVVALADLPASRPWKTMLTFSTLNPAGSCARNESMLSTYTSNSSPVSASTA